MREAALQNVLIKVGRYVKALQISGASPAGSSILQVSQVNIFALPIYPHAFCRPPPSHSAAASGGRVEVCSR